MDMDMDMDPSTLHLHQEMGSLESMLVCTKKQQQQQQEAEAEQQKKPRPAEQALKCPRCDSTNTKFCYYNNYSLSQPRYFCKGCRRYWTKGGTLRNVPVGGGCRKNKRSSSSSSSKLIRSSSSNSTHLVSDHHHGSPLIIPSSSPYLGTPGHLGVIDHDHHHHAHGVSILGNPFDILGNPNSAPAAHHHLIQSLYNYEGFGSGNLGDVENVGGNSVYVSEDMAMQSYDHHHHHQHQDVKQESCGDENRPALWGFPWQLNGEMTNLGLGSGGNSEGEFYQVRESWNGLGGGWHGLLNSPLM